MEHAYLASLLVFGSFGLWYIVGASSISWLWMRFLGTDEERKAQLVLAIETKSRTKAVSVAVKTWLRAMIGCPWCFGFWEGLVFGYMIWRIPLLALALGCVICGTNGILSRFARD